MRKKFVFLLGFLIILTCLFSGSLRGDRTIVSMKTSKGDMVIELYNDEAPKTVENFLRYVDESFYDGLIFHRVIQGFMVQGGAYKPALYDYDFSVDDPNTSDPEIFQEPYDPIELETDANLKNLRGRIAMARTNAPDSATSQFFINQVDNAFLDPGSGSDGYAVFGEVTQGLNVVDDIAAVEQFEEADDPVRFDFFQDLPVAPVLLEEVTVLREFGPDSDDFADIPYLHAADNTIRTFAGQADKAETSFRHVFEQIAFLGVESLEWKLVTDVEPDEIATFTIVMSRDDAGNLWLLKYVFNEGTDNEVSLIEAESLIDGVAFADFADQSMQFRLMTGGVNPDDLEDPCNTIVTGEGAGRVVEEIVSFSETVPGFEQTGLVLVKKSVGPAGSETVVSWDYYHESVGLVLTLVNEAGDENGDGWGLAQMKFDDDSADFSEIAFLKVPTIEETGGESFIRTYVGKGTHAGLTYTQTFTYPSTPFLGVKYVRWEQKIIGTNPLVDNFTLNMARDEDGNVWAFKYVLNGETVFDAASLLEAVRLQSLTDVFHFRLISGNFNPDDVDDPCNTFTALDGGVVRTTTITGFNETAPHIPVFTGALIKVVSYLETDPCMAEAETFYFQQDVGLLSDNRDGEVGEDADGFDLAFFGGTFDEASSFDLSDKAFLMATDGTTRTFIGQGDYDGLNYTHTFDKTEFRNKMCLLWTQSKVQREADEFPLVDKIETHLARDNMENLWVLQLKVNDVRLYRAANNYQGRLLQTFDNLMPFRLITGQYDADDPCAVINQLVVEDDDEVLFTEQIVDFSVDFNRPYYEDRNFAVRREDDPCHVFVDWSYYNKDIGLVFNFRNRSQVPNDPNYFDYTMPVPIDTGVDGFRLGWYGREEPVFNADSKDFSSVPYLKAAPGDFRIYRGQGAFTGSSYRQSFNADTLLEVSCLNVKETGVEPSGKMTLDMHFARDSQGDLWIFRDGRNDIVVFETSLIDQIVPFDLYPDMRLRLMSDTFDETTAVTVGPEEMLETELVVSLDEDIDHAGLDEDLAENLVLVRWTADDPCVMDIDWSYYSEDTGLVLELWDDFYDPNLEDPCLLDPSIIETDGDGWYLADPCSADDLVLTVRAGRDRSRPGDSFVLKGQITGLADPCMTVSGLTMQVGPWRVDIPADDAGLRADMNAGLLLYKGSPDGVCQLTVKIDFRREMLIAAAKRIDLTGLSEPVTFRMLTGDFLAAGTAGLRAGQEVPIILLRGQKDIIRKKRFKFVYDNVVQNNSLLLSGEIATRQYPIDLTDKTITIKWGNTTVDIDDGDLIKHPHRYLYSFQDKFGSLRNAVIDLDNGFFQVFIRKTALAKPDQTFTLTIKDETGDEDEVLFNKSVKIERP